MKDVLWAGLGEVKREDLIRWEVVSLTKEKVVWVCVGFFVEKQVTFGKWLWHFSVEKEALWHMVIGSFMAYGYRKHAWDAKLLARGSSTL